MVFTRKRFYFFVNIKAEGGILAYSQGQKFEKFLGVVPIRDRLLVSANAA